MRLYTRPGQTAAKERPLNRLAVFDLDGTLHDSSAALTPAITLALEEVGVASPGGGVVESLYGQPLSVILSSLVPDPGLRPAFVEALVRIQARTVSESGRAYPGVPEMLLRLRSGGWRTAVCSNAGRSYVEMVLSAIGLSRLIDRAEGLGGFQDKAGSLSGILASEKPGRAFMIGDRHLDFQAAKANGLMSIGCAWGFGDPSELSQADLVADSPSSVPGLLEDLLRRSVSLRSG